MHVFTSFRCALLGLTLALAGCSKYASVSTQQLTYGATTPAGVRIAEALRHPDKEPLRQIGGYLDAAAIAGQALKTEPDDTQARTDYNFALSRLMEVINEAGFQPWITPLQCPGEEGPWIVRYETVGPKSPYNPAFFRVLPADRYEFKGRLVTERTIKPGLGAPLVINNQGFDATTIDPFAQGRSLYYGLTAIAQFNNRQVTLTTLDPLARETVDFNNRTYPLAADFTAPIGLALAELKPRKMEVARMFKPDKFKATTRLARLQPYDPEKIPVLLIHGLGDSQATWAPMIESLRGDATIRKNYQFWFFSYPTGYPYPLMASVLREQLKAMKATYPDHKKMVVVGHSMGGMIARSLITDSGLNLWNAYFDTPPEQTNLPEETLQIMKGALVFQPHPDISRVIFASASLRGSDMATNLLGRLGSKLIGSPSVLLDGGQEALRLAKPSDVTGNPITRMPNSVDALDPENRFLLTINALPLAPGIPYHSIIGDRGKGGNLNHVKPVSTDGIVPYWSSHLDGAQSELIVPSDHWSNQNPQAIAEVNRILKQHLGAAAR